jgi:glycosyltransferase involved in cell wall biosynthesis
VRICSITPHQLLNNPRIVREADALSAAGHDVTVIAVRKRPDHSQLDEALARGRRWRLDRIDIEPTPHGRPAWLVTGARQKTAQVLWRLAGRGGWLATSAYCRTAVETKRSVSRSSPDLIIAHTQPMLGVANEAARRLGCPWGFDCEDILSEEYGEGIDDPAHQRLVRYLEARFIPAADFVTVASPEFSPWLEDRYGVKDSVYVANVPSASDGPSSLGAGYPDTRPHLSLYWFSISLGPRRGVEDAIRALPLIKVPVRLHLRGRVLPGYDRELRALVGALNVADRVTVHELVPPGEVVGEAAAHDVGLVLTQPCCENHELAVPNKIYAYVMAGLAVGATATRGHRSVLKDMPGVFFDYPPGNPVALAECLNALVREPGRLRACRTEAFRLGRERFNWEVEQARLVNVVDRLRPRSAAAWYPASTRARSI